MLSQEAGLALIIEICNIGVLNFHLLALSMGWIALNFTRHHPSQSRVENAHREILRPEKDDQLRINKWTARMRPGHTAVLWLRWWQRLWTKIKINQVFQLRLRPMVAKQHCMTNEVSRPAHQDQVTQTFDKGVALF